MKNSSLIVDSEIRVVHPAARKINYLKNSTERVLKDIYNHPAASQAMKLWGIESVIESMDKCNINFGLLSGLAWKDPKILKENNDYVKSCLLRYPQRLRGLYNASTVDPEQSAKDIMQIDKKIYIGVELIPKWQDANINDANLDPIISAVKKRNFFLKIYTAHPTQTLDGDAPYRTLQFLKKNPNVNTLIPHLGGLLCLYGLFSPIRKLIKNAYFITSVSDTMKMVKFASEVNPDNLLFGTDFPFNNCFNQKSPLEEMYNMKISDDVKNNILGRKAFKLFGFDKI